MKTGRFIALAVAGLALGAGSVAVAKGKSKHVKPTGKVLTVHVRQMKFVPPMLDAQLGDTVVWQNDDLVPHSATSDAKDFDTGLISPGQSAKVVMQKAGEIPYHCSNHPEMEARLTVK